MAPKKKVLLISAWMDLPTTTSLFLVHDILDYASTKPNIDMDYMFPPFGIRPLFHLRNKLENYDAVFYIGHGESNKLYGQHMFWSLINKKNVGKLKGAIIATMACNSGNVLGPEAIRQGVKAYIGATDLIFAAFPEKHHNYLKDWVDVFSSYFRSLLDGKSVIESLQAFYGRSDHYINFYKLHKNDQKENGELVYKNMDWYLQNFIHNKNVVKGWGNLSASLKNIQ